MRLSLGIAGRASRGRGGIAASIGMAGHPHGRPGDLGQCLQVAAMQVSRDPQDRIEPLQRGSESMVFRRGAASVPIV